MFRKQDFKKIFKKKWSRIKITIFFVLLSLFFLFAGSLIPVSEDTDLDSSQTPAMSKYDPQVATESAQSLNEMLGMGLEKRTDDGSWSDYELISENNFIEMLNQHFKSKEEIDFRGVSVFNSAYRIPFSTDGNVQKIDTSQRQILDVAAGEDVSSHFSHVLVKSIDKGKLYFFIQDAFVDQFLSDWEKYEQLDLYAFMPYVDHYSNNVPLLVNSFAIPRIEPQKSVNTQPPSDQKSYCWVSKNGTFEMTSAECLAMSQEDPQGFQIKSYQYCLDGKNPVVGDEGSSESRKEQCSQLTGITEIKNNE